MIYTLTMNPSLDYIVDIEQFRVGLTNRTTKEQMFPGGKGFNVSMVLQNLGMKNTALGFVAGFTGEEIVRKMQETGVHCEFIRVENGISRINVKLRTMDGTEINGIGAELSKEHLEILYKKLECLKKEDILVLAGSVPKTVPETFYADVTKWMTERGVKVVVDASGALLKQVLSCQPFLIKPNRQELSEFFGIDLLMETSEIVTYAKKLQEQGAKNVLVSLGGDGAILLSEQGETYTQHAPKGEVVNSVGAGDSMVAGFLYGYETYHSYEKALSYGLAAGSASAFSEQLATKEGVEKLLTL